MGYHSFQIHSLCVSLHKKVIKKNSKHHCHLGPVTGAEYFVLAALIRKMPIRWKRRRERGGEWSIIHLKQREKDTLRGRMGEREGDQMMFGSGR